MPKITRISEQKANPEKFNVFIDGEFCSGIRKRTFKAMGLDVGSEISCSELKEKEDFFWKQTYAEDAWKKEKIRLDRIKAIVEGLNENIKVVVVGFGADTTALIKEHPDEKGVPDLNVLLKNTNELVMMIEVTGTEIMRGNDYWIRPDKIDFAKNHPDKIVWTALHYSMPSEIIRFVKHIPGKKYKTVVRTINGADEIYCSFDDKDEEVMTLEEFQLELEKAIKGIEN